MTRSHQQHGDAPNDTDSEYVALLNELVKLKGKDIDLPQLVVVGDQSSGKSSVVKALSNIPVPIAEGLSTRFPIEIILRRADTPHTSMGIEGHTFYKRDFEMKKIPELINEATEAMGITPAETTPTARHFSDKVLTLKISGPSQVNLNFLDLPGIFTAETSTQNKQGMELVNKLVKTHVRNDKNIVLLVVSARKSLNDQNTLGLVKDIEGAESRTVGVVTHPDDSQIDSDPFKLIENREFSLDLGWCCIRNLSTYESSNQRERDQVESDFFRSQKWSHVSEEKKGIRALREKLMTEMFQHTKRQLPTIVDELHEKKTSIENQLKSLPPNDGTKQNQIEHLNSIARRFEKLLANAVNGTYSDDTDFLDFFGIYDEHKGQSQIRRLRANIRELSKVFIYTMRKCGQEHKMLPNDSEGSIRDSAESKTSENSKSSSEEEGSTNSGLAEEGSPITLSHHPGFHQMRQDSFLTDDLFRHYEGYHVSQDITRAEFEDLVKETVQRFRGKEAPSEFGESSMSVVFIQESRKWKNISVSHLKTIKEAVHKVVLDALEFCAQKPLSDDLILHVIDPNIDRLWESLDRKLEDLLKCHHSGNTGLLDTFTGVFPPERESSAGPGLSVSFPEETPDFMYILAKGLQSSFEEAVGNAVLTSVSNKLSGGIGKFFLDNLTSVWEKRYQSTGSEHLSWVKTEAVTRMVGQFEKYYAMNLITFVGYVNAMVIEDTLLKKLPKSIFYEQIVSELTDDKIEKIFKKSENMAAKRKEYEDVTEELDLAIRNLYPFLRG
ncbi:P-loop containing nucleoside triphosphate hydrolase protein [Aspergillus steynii IBT 23096]|uniref:P-loop containing nucleoside triphosphate hydrolase protein n=1 Tax=Aspergillus steynii IBT 23096 TaxID=1392250 RepID=A0A2I2FUY0_9EURO|nr:P-loop containing nucleoside triphosphate hydrolase protein [Aspergillus steynii IBT 23096]PLB44432.1 P-loop containing nucleoside triphosphate hydrolase protein [Aspergillus steynii IBT 23096]